MLYKVYVSATPCDIDTCNLHSPPAGSFVAKILQRGTLRSIVIYGLGLWTHRKLLATLVPQQIFLASHHLNLQETCKINVLPIQMAIFPLASAKTVYQPRVGHDLCHPCSEPRFRMHLGFRRCCQGQSETTPARQFKTWSGNV